MTNLNQQILDMIQTSDGHLTAEEAFLLAKKRNINVSVASIYRILGKLVEEGLISKFSIAGKADVYDKTVVNHSHLKCIKCGKIVDADVKNFKKILSKQLGTNIYSYELNMNYVCEKCAKKEKK